VWGQGGGGGCVAAEGSDEYEGKERGGRGVKGRESGRESGVVAGAGRVRRLKEGTASSGEKDTGTFSRVKLWFDR